MYRESVLGYQMWLLSPLILLPPQGCRSVEEFQCLNRIEEGTYGVVYRAKDKKTDEIVALKRLKMEKEKEGFPITSLREINTILKAQHPNIVTVRVRLSLHIRHALPLKAYSLKGQGRGSHDSLGP